MNSFNRKENGSSEEFSNLPKVTQLVRNLNLNSNPPHSLARTKPQEQTIMERPLGSQKRPEGGRGEFYPHGEMTENLPCPESDSGFHTFTQWLLNRLLRQNQNIFADGTGVFMFKLRF